MSDLFDLMGKVAVVTGGAGGIGRAQALGLADAGADVVVASRKPEHLKKVADEIKAKGRRSLAVTVDVSDEQSVTTMVKRVLEEFPRIDILVNAAGISIRKPADTFPIDEWQQVMDVNTRGTFLCCQAVGKIMIKRRNGKIINIASVNGIGAFPERVCYGSAKAGVIQLTRALGCEWARYNINVNAIVPGYIKTHLVEDLLEKGILNEKDLANRTPSGRLGKCEEIADAVVFLASEESKYIVGQTIVVDGGWSAYA